MISRHFTHIWSFQGQIASFYDKKGHVRDISRTTCSVFIFSSDNGGKLSHDSCKTNCNMGGASNGLLRGEKGMLFDGGVRVVGFMRSREHFKHVEGPRPVQFNGLMHLIDWMPTMYSMAKCPAKVKFAQMMLDGENIDGISQWQGILREVRKQSYKIYGRESYGEIGRRVSLRHVYGRKQKRPKRKSKRKSGKNESSDDISKSSRIRYHIKERKELLHHLGSKKLVPELNEEQRRFFSQCTVYNLKTTPQVALRKNYYQDYTETRLVASFKLLIRSKTDEDEVVSGEPDTQSYMYLFDISRDPFEKYNLIGLDEIRKHDFSENYRRYACRLLDRLDVIRRQVQCVRTNMR